MNKMNEIKEAFLRVKNDINELRAQLSKLVDRVDNLAIEVRRKKRR